MNFSESISKCFANYANFNGRASRSEYWWFFLFVSGLEFVADVWDYVSGDVEYGFMIWIIFIVTIVPSIAVGARRLHDVGRSGWYQLLAITIVGIIPLVFWLASEGDAKKNRFSE